MTDESTANELPETGGFQGQSLSHGSGSGHSWGTEVGRPLGPPELPPTPTWAFDAQKLTRLLARRTQSFAVCQDAYARERSARAVRERLRSEVDTRRASGAQPTAEQLNKLAFAESRLAEIEGEVNELRETHDAVSAVASVCEEWARARGWTPDGERSVADAGPIVHPGEAPMPSGGPEL